MKDSCKEIINLVNSTDREYEVNKTIIDLFEKSVEEYPNKKAVVMGEESISYMELNRKINIIANELRNRGVKRNDIIGIMIPRSIEMIIGIFAILKAGAAYLPIDINYPISRKNYILKDSKAKLLLVKDNLDLIQGFENTTININEIKFEKGNINNPSSINEPHDLAYVIYTSGSTGTPKGVLIEHHSLINRLSWMQNEYPIDSNDVILQKTVFTFDVSVWEIFWWAIKGATVVLLANNKEHNPRVILKTIVNNKITVVHFVPSVFRIFLEYLEIKDSLKDMDYFKYIFTSGEELLKNYVEKFFKLRERAKVKLINLYGPTEATIDVTHFDCENYKENEEIPIGKPIDNTKIFILNEEKNSVNIGEVGEIYIGGVGLAKGYLNREDLTAKSFVHYNNISNGRLYKTGDLGRWTKDGNIEYLGRKDFQVKLRGLRIELGEIESNLRLINSIKDALVLVKTEADNQFLCAYIVIDEPINKDEIIENLKDRIPEYMIPQIYIEIDSMPLKSNGKIDREKLLQL